MGPTGGARLSGRRFLSLNQEMLVLIRSGLPILQVLDTLIDRMEAGRLLDTLREIRADVKGGGALSDAFGRFPGMFPQLYVASLRAGEQSGDLPVTLARYIAYQKRVEVDAGQDAQCHLLPVPAGRGGGGGAGIHAALRDSRMSPRSIPMPMWTCRG